MKYIKNIIIFFLIVIAFLTRSIIRGNKRTQRRENIIQSVKFKDWQEKGRYYNNSLCSFYVKFPDRPEVENTVQNTKHGKFKATLYKSVYDRNTYSIWCIDYKEAIVKGLPCDELIRELIYAYKDDDDFEFNKFNYVSADNTFESKAYDVTFKNFYKEIPLYHKMRILINNNILYNLFVTTLKREDLENKTATYFFNSFKAK